MTIKWTPEIEQRFTELRLRRLSGSLTESKQRELAEIQATVEVVETEQIALQEILGKTQDENKDLVKLLNQQALLIADTKRWLAI